MNVSAPVHGGLLLSWGHGGRPPMPRRGHCGWRLWTIGDPAPETVIDSQSYEADAKFLNGAPARHPGDPFEGYSRYRLYDFPVVSVRRIGPLVVTTWDGWVPRTEARLS